MEKDLEVLEFEDQQKLEKWLSENGTTSPGVWLKIAKKAASRKTVAYGDAVESCLCYGWIDGRKKPLDSDFWLQRLTPRKRPSIWSQINRERAEALIAQGRMRESGMAAIDAAKKDGSWDKAYPSFGAKVVPQDLAEALSEDSRAQSFFESLDSQNRYAILFRIQNVKRPETRVRKIKDFVEMLARKETLHPKKKK